jgi:hypothetical protein
MDACSYRAHGSHGITIDHVIYKSHDASRGAMDWREIEWSCPHKARGNETGDDDGKGRI